ncbi:MAG: MBL fold metallo-hydrolase [Anaerolineae bacterium]|nr:MBL fold metallo-hydrolase [Anaerolineae bacterium]
MQWERTSEDVYVFTSDLYAQVTASLVVAGEVGVLIDTLPFPEETAQIALIARKHCPKGVQFIIYTGHEADHIYGAYLFPKAEIIAHELCRQTLETYGAARLERAKAENPALASVRLRLPTFTFPSGTVTLCLPGRTLEIIHTPGHTPDCVCVLLREESILFAGDTVMALPAIADRSSDPAALRQVLERISAMSLENVIQGHGEIILRGEVKDTLKRQIAYLDAIQSKVTKIVESGGSQTDLEAITLESCGMQRVLLNGAAPLVHRANLRSLYDRLVQHKQAQQAAAARTKRTASKSTAEGSSEQSTPETASRARRTATKTAAAQAEPKTKKRTTKAAKEDVPERKGKAAKRSKAEKAKPAAKTQKRSKKRSKSK